MPGETTEILARGAVPLLFVALLGSVRLDRRGRVLEASAFDPDHFS